jgi:hypothetical protein
MGAPAAERVAALLTELAREPRPAGSAAEERGRRLCEAFLRERGFETRDEPFEYSTLVGRWATPVCGLLAVVILLTAGHVGYRWHAPGLSLGVLLAGGLLLAVIAWWLVRHGVLALPLSRTRGVNLVATRGAPRVWLVAHLDTKSQPVPLLLRATGIVLVGVAWVAAAVTALAQARGIDVGAFWYAVTAFGVASCLPIIATTVGSNSPGALDNASGVVTVLETVDRLPRETPLGVLLPSAEELGLAGARAWARGREAARAINVDGVDDEGRTTIMYSTWSAPRIAASLGAAAAATDVAVRQWRMVPGVLTDSIALADAGWDAVTVSRGGAHTLARIHTPRDSVGHLRGVAIPAVAGVIAAAVQATSRE